MEFKPSERGLHYLDMAEHGSKDEERGNEYEEEGTEDFVNVEEGNEDGGSNTS